jgi:hypothetical protein
MQRVQLNITIAATPERVWRALCDPAEVVLWDSGVAEALDAPLDYPRPGQRVRWRLRSGPFPVLLDEPQVVLPERVLRSLLSYGPYRLDETYILTAEASGCRLAVEIDVKTTLPLVGGLVESAYLTASVRRDFAASLAAIKRHCETSP